jgi:hypothetical protein
MAILRSSPKHQQLTATAAEASTFIDIDMDFSGPVAAAKNRASRNISIAQSKADMKSQAPQKDKTVLKKRANPNRNSKKSAAKAKKITNKGEKVYTKNYTFPFRLYDILNAAEKDGFKRIISFNEDGDEFVIHDHHSFATLILPLYFGHSNMRSFDRQCSYWGFKRTGFMAKNSDSGGVTWSHPLMQRGHKDLLQDFQRREMKGAPLPPSVRMKTQMKNFRAKMAEKKQKQQSTSKVIPPSPQQDNEESDDDHSKDASVMPDLTRAVSPFTESVLQEAVAPFSLDTAIRRVSNNSLTVMDTDKPAMFALPFMPEDALEDGDDITLFPEIDAESVMASADDPLDVNPVHLIDPHAMTDEDDEVSLLSMHDPDESFTELHDDMDDLFPLVINNVNVASPTGLAEFQYTDDAVASFIRDHDPTLAGGHCTAFAQV